jgi:Xaa-Pro dipeptidase
MQTLSKTQSIQQALADMQCDGWLLYDFRRMNDLGCQFLEIPSDQLLTRRFFYWIPSQGEPIKLVHQVESHVLEHLPGKTQLYRTWQELEEHLLHLLRGCHQIAMEYSPRNAIPYVSKVDAGTLEIIKGFGVEVVSSADLLQKYTSVWSHFQFQKHLEAAEVLCVTASNTWDYLAHTLQSQAKITEYDVQQFMIAEMTRQECISSDPPICAVNAHSANPHYAPHSQCSTEIKRGDFVLIDLWCKKNIPTAVYADITRVAVAAPNPTPRQQEIFALVKKAQETGTGFLQSRLSQGRPPMGWEVDQVCRQVISDAGYGEYFVHRTGHNIGETDHGSGANLDNFETQDRRLLLPGTCFSVEPGIYLPGEFGVRLEYDVFIHPDGRTFQITGGIQDKIVCLM